MNTTPPALIRFNTQPCQSPSPKHSSFPSLRVSTLDNDSLAHLRSFHPGSGTKDKQGTRNQSRFNQTVYKEMFKDQEICSVGTRRKPLVAFDANHSRNRLPFQRSPESKALRNHDTFQNYSHITNTHAIRDIFQSTYQTSFMSFRVSKSKCR